MMTELVLQTPEVFKPLDQPSRYKGAFGGGGRQELALRFDGG